MSLFSSLEPVVHEFTFDEKKYVLREPSEAAVSKYTLVRHQAKLYEEGKGTDKVTFSEAQLAMVGMCLFALEADDKPKVDKEGRWVPVGKDALAQWPSRTVTAMFTWLLQHINRDSDTTAEALKEQIKELQERLRLKEEGKEGNS